MSSCQEKWGRREDRQRELGVGNNKGYGGKLGEWALLREGGKGRKGAGESVTGSPDNRDHTN